MEKLKECPFCGSYSDLFVIPENGVYFIQCKNCETEGPPAEKIESAKDKWNHRPYRITHPEHDPLQGCE